MDPVKQCCRLCLAPSPKKYASITDYALRSKLDAIFKFELLLEDSLPHVICSECSIKIDEFYFFHETVRTNQDQLKSVPVPDTDLLMLVEIKEEPLHLNDTDAEEEELTDTTAAAAAVDQNDLASLMSELYGPGPAQNKYVQDEKSKKMMEDNLKILQFFNGVTCSICSEEFKTFGQLMAHGKTEHDEQVSISCCDRKFIKKSILIQHINLHLNIKQFFCEPCQKNYTTKYCLDMHNLKVHANPEHHEYQCNKCPKKFPRKSFLSVHLRRHIKVKCSICDQMLSNIDSLRNHMLKVHNKKHRNSLLAHTCDTCGQAFHLKKNLQRHIELQHLDIKNADRIQCPVCPKWVSNKRYLKNHIRNMHSGENLQATCNICQQVYLNKRLLTIHINSMHTERNLECDVCGKMFKLQKHLNYHIQNVHSGKNLQATCNICQQVYLNKRLLAIHMNSVHTERNIECDLCSKKFKLQKHLNYHIQNVHSAENLHVTCDICQQVYPNKRVLTTHKNNVHTERNLECDICGKMFKMQKHLKEHRAAHTDHKQYPCPVCNGYASNYKSNVYKHMKTQHPAEWAEEKK